MKRLFLSFFIGLLTMNVFAWNTETLTAIDKADDLKIAPERANGKTGTPTWIWEVVVDGRLFVRPYNGKNSSWYKSAMEFKKGIIVAAGKTHQVEFQQIEDADLIKRVSDAYREKYKSSSYMNYMIQDKIAAQTVEIIELEGGKK
ncbi:MAG: DUF2255 family protein [Cardiobacteriaceae bacterium]|nr:DUF2255 family protein [Cardiobacteriaceae bacterium]